MDEQSLQYAKNKFGLNLFKNLCKDSKDKNKFLSPVSIQVALAMALIGARGKTAEEINRVLAWDKFGENNVHKTLQEYLNNIQNGKTLYQLSLVNRIYTERTFGVIEQFSQAMKTFYCAEPVKADFKEDAENERVKINTWVAEQTNNKIQDLLVSDILNSDSRMILINAVYFKGIWEHAFLARHTSKQPFKVDHDKTVNVPTMTCTQNYGFTRDTSLQCTALEMTYRGDELSMVIVLPDEDFGLEDLIQKLDVEKFNRLLTNVRNETDTISLSLPKFELTSSFSLKQPLASLGMPDAFSTSANFSGISLDRKGLLLSDVIHKSFIQVDENGTEASTATAAIMIPECDIESTPLNFNHPFLFAIVDRRYNNLLMFLGKITDPSIKD